MTFMTRCNLVWRKRGRSRLIRCDERLAVKSRVHPIVFATDHALEPNFDYRSMRIKRTPSGLAGATRRRAMEVRVDFSSWSMTRLDLQGELAR